MSKLLDRIHRKQDDRTLRRLERALNTNKGKVMLTIKHADDYLAFGKEMHFSEVSLRVDPEG